MMKYIFQLILFLCVLHIPAFSQNEDLSLSKALEKALNNNYGIEIAKKNLDIAELNDTWGTAGRYPKIDFSLGDYFSMDIGDYNYNRITTGAGFSFTLFDGFSVNITKEKLALTKDLTEGMLQVYIENTIEDVILAWNNILLQNETLKVFKTLQDLSYDRYNYESQKYDLGGTVRSNVLQAKNVYLSDKGQYLKQEAELRKSIRLLNVIMGENIGNTWQIEGDFSADTTNYQLEDLNSRMLENNRVLKNQYINISLKEKNTLLQKSELYPTLNLSAGIENVNTRNTASGGNTTTSMTFGPYANLSLSYTLFKGGNRKRAIETAKIEEEISNTEMEELEKDLMNELYLLYDNFTLRKELLEISREGIEAASLNLTIADEKFRAGAINSFNYRDIQLIYLNTALENLSAKYNLIVSQTALTRITGGFLH